MHARDIFLLSKIHHFEICLDSKVQQSLLSVWNGMDCLVKWLLTIYMACRRPAARCFDAHLRDLKFEYPLLVDAVLSHVQTDTHNAIYDCQLVCDHEIGIEEVSSWLHNSWSYQSWGNSKSNSVLLTKRLSKMVCFWKQGDQLLYICIHLYHISVTPELQRHAVKYSASHWFNYLTAVEICYHLKQLYMTFCQEKGHMSGEFAWYKLQASTPEFLTGCYLKHSEENYKRAPKSCKMQASSAAIWMPFPRNWRQAPLVWPCWLCYNEVKNNGL